MTERALTLARSGDEYAFRELTEPYRREPQLHCYRIVGSTQDAEDLREWFLAFGRPDNKTPVFPAHDGKFWDKEDWANWRRRIWQGRAAEPATTRNPGRAAQPGAAPAGTRPRDLRSSYVTLRVYEGVPLTTISREVGTSVLMIERHYAGVIENWDGHRVPPEAQIRAARAADGRGMDVLAIQGTASSD